PRAASAEEPGPGGVPAARRGRGRPPGVNSYYESGGAFDRTVVSPSEVFPSPYISPDLCIRSGGERSFSFACATGNDGELRAMLGPALVALAIVFDPTSTPATKAPYSAALVRLFEPLAHA